MKKILSLLLSVLMLLSVLSVNSFAETADFTFRVTYQQTEARKVLKSVNKVRTSGTAWYWNENNTKKIKTGKLGELTYDYDLEKTAMQRAAELVLQFDHYRPDGTLCFSAFGDYWSAGENIAMASYYWEADGVFEAWMEEDEPYSGQGHRRNILGSDFTAIGMAMCTYQGKSYWVMELGYPASDTAETKANDSKTTVKVAIDDSNSALFKSCLTIKNVKLAQTSYTYTGNAKKPELTVKNSYSYPLKNGRDYKVKYCCSGGCRKAGTHTVTVTGIGNYSGTVKKTFTIKKQALSSSKITLSKTSFKYTKKVITPTVTVKNYSGTVIKNGTDYKITYCCAKGCKTKGTHKVTITGKGNYSGKITKTFKIK